MFQRTDKLKNKLPVKLLTLLVFTVLSGFGCEPSPSMMGNTSNTTPVSETSQADANLTSLERELRDIKEADFKFIYVLKRRDGGVFDKEDKQFIRENRPIEINRFSITDDEKAYVIGSNFEFLPENMELLRKRFVIEDYSKPAQTNQQQKPPPPPPPAANNTNQTQSR